MTKIPVIRSSVKYVELPDFVLFDEMPAAIHAKVLAVMGDDALDIHDDAIAFTKASAPGVLRYLGQLGVKIEQPMVTTAEEHRGIMVCLYPPKDVAEKFSVDGGEPAENMHITLGYLGKMDELPEDAYEKAIKACEEVAAEQESLSGEIGGIGRWAAGDEDCVYASVDLPGSNEFRAKLCEALEAAGVPARTNHGWSAHMTIQYLEPDLEVKMKHVDPVKVSFGSVWVVSGDKDRKEIRFGGAGKTEDSEDSDDEAKAFNVLQRRGLDKQRSERDLQTVLDNARDGHVGDQNADRVKKWTGLDPRKTKDREKLQKTIEVSPPSTTTSALERKISEKLGWW